MPVYPMINLNGSDPQSMIDSHQTAMDRLEDALEALKDVAPHGRDYPGSLDPAGCAAMDQAVREHRERVAMLRKVQYELLEIAFSIHSQVNIRNTHS